ncbi:MAG: protein kinase [archaeon]|nr:protein kinase [archaeon]
MDNYKKGKKLGAGSFGKVYLVTSKTGKQYVMKELEISKDNKLEDVQREGEMMKLLNCPYITKFIDGFPNNEDGYNLVMEYCNGGDLEKVIKDAQTKNQPIPENELVKYFLQMCLGVGYIHTNNMIHRDLKPANIFLMKDKTVKIGDLGLTKKVNQGSMATTFCGTMLYMAPEILMQSPYGQKVDVWAIGTMLYEMMALKHPFQDSNPMLLYQKILSGTVDPIETNYPQPLKDIALNILKTDPKERDEIKDILKNNYLIKKAQELGMAQEMGLYLGVQIKGVSQQNDEITKMQKYLIEDLGLDSSYFDFSQNNQDGGWAKDVETISGFEYNPPHGWYGIGLNIRKLYPNAHDDTWIKPGRASTIGTWPIAYHGLRPGYMPIKDKICGIIKGGLREGPNQQQANDEDLLHKGRKCGKGVYHYYNIKSLIYNQNVGPDEKGNMFIFMCRVDPTKIRQPTTNNAMWILNGTKDETRPYRLLFRKVHVAQ